MTGSGRTFDDPFRPMSHAVARIAQVWFDLSEDFEGQACNTQPVGLIVGEQPGAGGNPKLPMWPFPSTSAGGRLLRMSKIPIEDYLIRLARTNLSARPVARWNAQNARCRANRLLIGAPPGTRILACGLKARNAFGVTEWFSSASHEVDGKCVEVVAIPHPSGKCREYNFLGPLVAAERWIRWTARWEKP